MPAIGHVTLTRDGSFKGQIRTLSIRAEIAITPVASKTSPSHPDYRIVSGETEIGAAWIRTGETSGKDYVSLVLAAPEFGPRRLYANLGRAAGGKDDEFALIWNPAD
ncbi:DUF736 domain-containing protein [Sphingobium boeckii]|uniref:Uncharacterized protein (DUF736 family) n=1 Tax=Sphingobium boeckii TaxID=1082345 RepID=A0A7W9ALD4_9SPHN|nr:DUF736 family protein [Sphingobium boeckii]MBB5687810.1 uncharacterized protein (DUF736 family) [Sphingobium boeckii]